MNDFARIEIAERRPVDFSQENLSHQVGYILTFQVI